LNRLGARKRGELYGGREAEIGRSLKRTRVQESRDRESVEGSRNNIKIEAPARGFWGTCEGLLEVNLHTSVSYCVVIRSCVVILHCVGISSCVDSDAKKGAYSKIEKHMRGRRIRQKIVSRRVGIIRQNVGDGAWCHVRGPGCQD